jgi:hypothetical protein
MNLNSGRNKKVAVVVAAVFVSGLLVVILQRTLSPGEPVRLNNLDYLTAQRSSHGDIEGDDDVDLADFAMFQQVYAG